MDKNGLTVIYLTASALPDAFAEHQRSVLSDAIGDLPLISVSRKPLQFGENLLDEEPRSYSNIYFQLLRAAKVAETDYIAVAEDDAFYPAEHFNFRPPNLDTFAYNYNRWALFTWSKPPIYSWKWRVSNCVLVAPRLLAIESLQERFDKYNGFLPGHVVGELGREKVDNRMGTTVRKCVEFYSTISVIQLNHIYATENRQQKRHKSLGQMRAYNIPHWGNAENFVKTFIEKGGKA